MSGIFQVTSGATVEEREAEARRLQSEPCPNCENRQRIREDYRRQINEVDRQISNLAEESAFLQRSLEHEQAIFQREMDKTVQERLEALRHIAEMEAEYNFLASVYGGESMPSFASTAVKELSN